MINKAKVLVEDLMKNEDTGHGMEHITRVLDLSMQFAENESCNKGMVALIALLHDVDDYKLFGKENQASLTNATKILTILNVDEKIKKDVLEQISQIGYSKSLAGKRPTLIEGQIVSDADMCDAIGANGILRVFQYELKHGKPFFDKNVWPMEEVSNKTYGKKCSDSAVCHMFEKILKLKNLMMTNSGKQESKDRHDFVVLFLKQLFREENANDWQNYLENYLKN